MVFLDAVGRGGKGSGWLCREHICYLISVLSPHLMPPAELQGWLGSVVLSWAQGNEMELVSIELVSA